MAIPDAPVVFVDWGPPLPATAISFEDWGAALPEPAILFVDWENVTGPGAITSTDQVTKPVDKIWAKIGIME